MAENNLCKAFDEFTQSIIDKDPGYCSIRREYLRMPLKQLIEVLFQKLNVLYTSVNYMYELHHNRHQLPAVSISDIDNNNHNYLYSMACT